MSHTDLDLYPEKDSSRPGGTNTNNAVSNDALRKMISQWKREDLEDKHLRLYEDHLVLKKHTRKQEDKIKRMATKLIRLASDQGRLPSGKAPHNVTQVAELKLKIDELQNANTVLQDKLLLAKNQLELLSVNKSQSNFDSVQPRVNKSLSKTPGGVKQENLRVLGPSPGKGGGYDDRQRLEQAIVRLNEDLNLKEQQIEDLKERLRVKESNFEEDLLRIKQRSAVDAKSTVSENLDFIKLQRELKEKSAALSALHSKFQVAEQQLGTLEATNQHLVTEVERLNHQLKVREEQSVRLQSEGKLAFSTQKKMQDLEQMLIDLRSENEVLKAANDRLTGSAFNTERERQWQAKEKALKTQIAQLEATLHRDVGEKGAVLGKLELEHDRNDQRERELSQLRIQLYETQEKYTSLQERMKYFTRDSELDMRELEEALLLVRQRREKAEAGKPLEFLQNVDDHQNRDISRKLQESEAAHAETIQELEKTRNMLIVQYKLNNDYKTEVDAVRRQLQETKATYEARLEEYAKLLDIRAARIRKLESQMKDVAYGTRQYSLKTSTAALPGPAEEEDLVDEVISLQRGENVLEIHLGRTSLTDDATKRLRSETGEDPQLFCTLDFYDFETQSTSVLRSLRPDFDITAQYPVKIDDFFLHYLQKDSCTVELHRAFGVEFETVAAGQLVCRSLLDDSHEQKGGALVQATCQLIGVQAGPLNGLHVATLDYWIRLRVPMNTALRLYRERVKALGYLANNTRAAEEAMRMATSQRTLQSAPSGRPPLSASANELHVKIVRCNNLRAKITDRQPSPYVVFKFFDFENEDTEIVPASSSPQFFYHKTFPIHMTLELDQFLRTQFIKFYVFDDSDPAGDASYLGIVSIPMLSLAHDKKIDGEFELTGMDGRQNGTIQVELFWQHPYMPSEAVLSIEVPASTANTRAELLPGEEKNLTRGSGTVVKVANKKDTQQRPERLEPTQPHPETKSILKPAVVTGFPEPMPVDQATLDKVRVGRSTVVSPPPGKKEVKEDFEVRRSPTREERARMSMENSLRSLGKEDRDEQSEVTTVSQDLPSSKSLKEPSLSEPNKQKSKSPTSVASNKSAVASPKNLAPVGPDISSDSEVVVPRASPRKGGAPDADGAANGDSLTPRGSLNSTGRNPAYPPEANSVTVEVHYVNFTPQCPVLPKAGAPPQDIPTVYVAYEFLDLPGEMTETPSSLPMPRQNDSNKRVDFNFSRTFPVDFENHYKDRQLLARMLLKNDPTNGIINFILINELYPDTDEEDAIEIGQGSVNVRQIFKSGKDWDSKPVPIYSMKQPDQEIAQLNVTVKVLAALRAIVQEMPDVELCLT